MQHNVASLLTQSGTDNILPQLHLGLDDEDRFCCEARREMELRLHSDGVRRRKVLRSSICAFQ